MGDVACHVEQHVQGDLSVGLTKAPGIAALRKLPNLAGSVQMPMVPLASMYRGGARVIAIVPLLMVSTSTEGTAATTCRQCAAYAMGSGVCSWVLCLDE